MNISELNVIVDLGTGKLIDRSMLSAEAAKTIRDLRVSDMVAKGIPEERLNIQVLNVEEALRGGYRPS